MSGQNQTGWRGGLLAVGLVYGDIGTSPLYAMREIMLGSTPVPPTPEHVIGVTSTVIWALLLVISFKYLMLVLRADNNGEGGILALLTLLMPSKGHWLAKRRDLPLLAIGLLGAALLYGDAIITPAISVLSAVEGLAVPLPELSHLVLPIAVGVLIALFLLQKRGTAKVAGLFGPIMLVWFLVIAGLGINGLINEPRVLAAFNPLYALGFLAEEGMTAFLLAGAIFLVVTGGEALYADMGHVGRVPIRLAWYGLVLPSLLLNYLGQAGLMLGHPDEVSHPFFHLAPDWALYPLIILATLASVIASQAVISGLFSMTRQGIQLGLLPRLRVVQTSAEEIGQIYVPAINRMLMVAVLATVLVFESADALASAYGVSVSTTMLLTTVLLVVMMHRRWKWPLAVIVPIGLGFIDTGFVAANYAKLLDGGWLPLAIGLGAMAVMATFLIGRERTAAVLRPLYRPAEEVFERLDSEMVARVPGQAIFLTSEDELIPPSVSHLMGTLGALHREIILLSIVIEDEPRVEAARRYRLEPLGHGFSRLWLHYGFMQGPDIRSALRTAEKLDMPVAPESATFISTDWRPAPRRPGESDIPLLMRFFDMLYRSQTDISVHLRLPPDRLITIGIQLPAKRM